MIKLGDVSDQRNEELGDLRGYLTRHGDVGYSEGLSLWDQMKFGVNMAREEKGKRELSRETWG